MDDKEVISDNVFTLFDKWEYMLMKAGPLGFDSVKFADVGSIGYELVSVDQGWAYFKRRIKPSYTFSRSVPVGEGKIE